MTHLPPSNRRRFRFWRADHDGDVRDELRFHLDEAIADEVARGRSPDDARTAAYRRFGDVRAISAALSTLSREGERRMHRKEHLDGLRQDVGFGIRQLRRNPGFATVALLTLGLGIGASTAIFSLVYSVLLRPLPYPDADRLVALAQVGNDGSARPFIPVPNALSWARDNHAFTAIGFTEWHSLTLTGAGDPVRWRGQRASAGYWRALGLAPEIGRFYTDTANQPTDSHVIVLAYGTWVTTFGADRRVIGRTIRLDDRPYVVVAVAPRAQTTTSSDPAFWIPFSVGADEIGAWGDHELSVIGRLRPGLTTSAATADLIRVERVNRVAHPDGGVTGAVLTLPLRETTVGAPRVRQLLVILAAAGLVLLIACGNVANLLLARGVSRRSELAVRAALGAGRGRLIRQLLAESLVLASGGAALGLCAAYGALNLLLANAPTGIPRLRDAAIDGPAVAFAIGAAVLAAMLFGIAPALRAAGTNVQGTLRETGRDGRGSRDVLRGTLIVAEIALALVLLTAAGLLLRSAARMYGEPTGFHPDSLVTARIALPDTHYGDDAAVIAGFKAIAERLPTLPGVHGAAMISRVPFGGGGADCGVTRADQVGDKENQHDADFRSITPGYFETMQTPLVAGRTLNATDVTGGPLVAVINASLAQKLFGTESAIGRQIVHCIGTGDGYRNAGPRTVVGVVSDVRADGLDQAPADQVYYPVTQFYERQMTIVLRSSVPAAVIIPMVRSAVASIDPALPLMATATMDELIARSTATQRFTMLLLLVLGASGVVLAATGIYGVINYQMTQRTREIGIRLALGATSGTVIQLVVRQGMALAAIGIVLGEVAGFFAARTLSALLYGVGEHDAVTFASAGLIVAVAATIASAVPALRATRLDPIRALRS